MFWVWKANEVAQHLEMSVSAVNSALLRARSTLQDDNYSQRYRTRPPDAEVQKLLSRYLAAWETTQYRRTHRPD